MMMTMMVMAIPIIHLAKKVVQSKQGSRQEENCTCEPAGKVDNDGGDGDDDNDDDSDDDDDDDDDDDNDGGGGDGILYFLARTICAHFAEQLGTEMSQ